MNCTSDLDQVIDSIKQVEEDIRNVEANIKAVEVELKKDGLSEKDVDYYREEKRQMREEKRQLREKENKLRDEKIKLQEKEKLTDGRPPPKKTRQPVQPAMKSPPGRPGNTKRRRMSHTEPTLPPCRLEGNRSDHQIVIAPQQRRCIYCSYLFLLAKIEGKEDPPRPREPSRKCLYCQVHICKDHWNVFHAIGS
ncbi:hypothetical protein IV203_021215 [Nitzschia inconspicua]|uniref:Uncharacterized protein n=1 Tax=Nitzschia inconspicua TaxID=303405 RepID=A0A9K3PDR2_9STRA|nr:hypothetical protein IV203_021215 [Nitzschia inconspicua]